MKNAKEKMDSESKSVNWAEMIVQTNEPPSWWREHSDVASVTFTEDGSSSVCFSDDMDVEGMNILELLEKHYDFSQGKLPRIRSSTPRPESSNR